MVPRPCMAQIKCCRSGLLPLVRNSLVAAAALLVRGKGCMTLSESRTIRSLNRLFSCFRDLRAIFIRSPSSEICTRRLISTCSGRVIMCSHRMGQLSARKNVPSPSTSVARASQSWLWADWAEIDLGGEPIMMLSSNSESATRPAAGNCLTTPTARTSLVNIALTGK